MPGAHVQDGTAREPVFEVRGLHKVYLMGQVEVHAPRGVDLDLAETELVVLVGRSGSGTSTLLHIIGDLADRVTDGTRVRARPS